MLLPPIWSTFFRTRQMNRERCGQSRWPRSHRRTNRKRLPHLPENAQFERFSAIVPRPAHDGRAIEGSVRLCRNRFLREGFVVNAHDRKKPLAGVGAVALICDLASHAGMVMGGDKTQNLVHWRDRSCRGQKMLVQP